MNWPRLGPCPLSCSSVFLYSAVRQAGQAEGYPFYPRPVLAFGYCRCLRLSVCPSVRPCVNHEFVRAITHHPFKLGSPNLDHRCKRPWLRSLLFGGWPSRSNLTSKSKFTPFWACPCHNSPSIEVTISKFGTKMHLSTVQIPTNFGLDWNWSSIQFLI